MHVIASPERGEPLIPDLTEQQTSQLLELSLPGPRRPVDQLIDRLRERDGERWLRAALESGPARGLAPIEDRVLGGGASLDELIAAKEESKRFRGRTETDESPLAGVALYFIHIVHLHLHDSDRSRGPHANLDRSIRNRFSAHTRGGGLDTGGGTRLARGRRSAIVHRSAIIR